MKKIHMRLVKLFIIFSVIAGCGLGVFEGGDKSNANSFSTWVKSVGEAEGLDKINVVRETKGGDLFLAGYSELVANDKNLWVVKEDANGNVTWAKSYGKSSIPQTQVNDVIETKDHGFAVVGPAGSGQTKLTKLNPVGEPLWSKIYPVEIRPDSYQGSGADHIHGISEDKAGNLYLYGDHIADVIVSEGNTGFVVPNDYDVLIIKINANGDLIWRKVLGVSGASDKIDQLIISEQGSRIFFVETYDLKVDENNNAVSSGNFIRARLLDSSGTVLWTYEDDSLECPCAIAQTDDDLDGIKDNGYIVVSEDARSNLLDEGDNLWVAKLNSNGEAEWTESVDPTDDEDSPLSVTQVTFPEGVGIRGYYVITGVVKRGEWVGDVLTSYTFSPNGDTDAFISTIGMSGDEGSAIVIGNNEDKLEAWHAELDLNANALLVYGIDRANADRLWKTRLDLANNLTQIDNTYTNVPEACHTEDESLHLRQTHDDGTLLVARSINWCISKTNADGSNEWLKTSSDNGFDEEAFAMEVVQASSETTDDGLIVAGSTRSYGAGDNDMWVLRLDNGGEIRWQKTFGGPKEDEAHALAVLPDGNFIVAGQSYSLDSSDENSDVWILRLNQQGDVDWTVTVPGSGIERVKSIVVTADGGIIAAGGTDDAVNGEQAWLLRLDKQGGIVWKNTYDQLGYGTGITSVIENSNGNFVAAGYLEGLNTWLAEVDGNGSTLWARRYNTSAASRVTQILKTTDGGLLLGGMSFKQESDLRLLKLNATGSSIEWQQTYGAAGYEQFGSLALLQEGGYLLAGSTMAINNQDDGWLIKTGSDGVVSSSCQASQQSENLTIVELDATPTITMPNSVSQQNSVGINWFAADTNAVPINVTSRMSVSRSCEGSAPVVSTEPVSTEEKVTLNINVSGQGVIVSSPAGINCGATCSASFDTGSSIVLQLSPADGWRFAGWSGDAACATEMTLQKDLNCTATFSAAACCTLTVDPAVGGKTGVVYSVPEGISCGTFDGESFTNCEHSYDGSVEVTLFAQPSSDASFRTWSGCVPQDSSPCTVNLVNDIKVEANFN